MTENPYYIVAKAEKPKNLAVSAYKKYFIIENLNLQKKANTAKKSCVQNNRK